MQIPIKQKNVLVVDDDPQIIAVVLGLLDDCDYNVITANSGANALRLSRDFPGEINLLLSDFEMPGMSGIELGTLMTAQRPELKVLLMSGYNEGMLILNEGWHFLSKPFVGSQLRALVTGMVHPNKKSARFAS